MGSLVFYLTFAALLIALIAFGSRRNLAHLDQYDERRLKNLRSGYEAGWMDALPALWSLLSLMAAVFLLVDGRWAGLGWLASSFAFALVILTRRSASGKVLEALGERGRVVPTENDRIKSVYVRRYGVMAFGAFAATQILNFLAGETPPTWVTAITVILTLITLVSGFLCLLASARHYRSREDPKRPARNT